MIFSYSLLLWELHTTLFHSWNFSSTFPQKPYTYKQTILSHMQRERERGRKRKNLLPLEKRNKIEYHQILIHIKRKWCSSFSKYSLKDSSRSIWLILRYFQRYILVIQTSLMQPLFVIVTYLSGDYYDKNKIQLFSDSIPYAPCQKQNKTTLQVWNLNCFAGDFFYELKNWHLIKDIKTIFNLNIFLSRNLTSFTWKNLFVPLAKSLHFHSSSH